MPTQRRPVRWTVDPARHLPSVLRSVPGDPTHRRRVAMLAASWALWAADEGASAPLAALGHLASVPWIRGPDRWPGPAALQGLGEHLLQRVRYPLPVGLWELLATAGPTDDRRRVARVLARLGVGGSLADLVREGVLPVLTRAECHALWTRQGDPTLTAACRAAKLVVAGADPALVEAVSASRLRDPQPDEAAWARHLAWLVAARFPAAEVGALVDWVLATGSEPGKRSAATVLSEVQAWHARRHAPVSVPLGPLPAAPWSEGEWEADAATWRMVALGTGAALVAEGQRLRHCVATYAGLAREGRISLWSLRRAGDPRVTVEVRHAERAVVQVRGFANRRADPTEERLVRRWADEQHLEISPASWGR